MVHTLVLSGGTGTRLGSSIPKQYIEVNDRRVISYCIETLARSQWIDTIQIVAAAQWHDIITDSLEQYDDNKKFKGFSVPGENRQMSVFNGLSDIRKYASDYDMVFIHDAARPFLTGKMIADCITAIQGHDGVLPVLSMKDTVYKSSDAKHIESLLDRNQIFAGQAPEVFVLGKYYEANRKLFPDKIKLINGSTEPAILAGMDIVLIPGDEGNFKITTADDLERFSQILCSRNEVR